MLTPRIKFVDFQTKKKKKIKIEKNFFTIQNLLRKYKLLSSLTTNYTYGYSKKFPLFDMKLL